MKLPISVSSATWVEPAEVARIATRADISKLGEELDAAMGALAIKTDLYCRDEVVLALLTVAESAFYSRGWREMRHDALVAAALDYTAALYPDTKAYSRASLGAVQVAGPWVRCAVDYDALVGALIHAAQGRMEAVVTRGGRMVFAPTSGFESELRNRWFDMRLQQHRTERGLPVVDEPALRAIHPAIDRHVSEQRRNLASVGRYTPPSEPWYVDVIDGISERALQGQFADVASTETWAGVSKAQMLQALGPLYRTAGRRVFANLRAYKFMREVLGAPSPMLMSVVEVATVDDLVIAAATASGLGRVQAREMIDSMIRKQGHVREGLLDHPLIPMHGARVAYMPSAVMFSAWPAQLEQAAARRPGQSNSVSRSRERRHVNALTDSLRGAGFSRVATDVVLIDPAMGNHLTDLDVVAVSDDLSSMLIIQLKSFVTPSNLLDIKRADRDVAKARDQCQVADDHPALVTGAVEKALGVRLQAGYRRRQVIVVEAFGGVGNISLSYPTVSIEWFVERLRRPLSRGLLEVWDDARDLPDAAAFADSVAPAFDLFDDQLRDLKLGRAVAVFGYGAGT